MVAMKRTGDAMATRREERGARGPAAKSRDDRPAYQDEQPYDNEPYDVARDDSDEDATRAEPGIREGRRTNERRRPRAPVRPALSAARAAQAGLRLITDLTGREVAGVTSLEPAGRGWVVGVEVIEDRRIPSSTDVLALYEAKIDETGELLASDRKRRYARGKGDVGETP
jgi:hypothetical protein